jgi:hypothetical protein
VVAGHNGRDPYQSGDGWKIKTYDHSDKHT